MARIISSFFISLDGVVEAPDQWHFDFWSDQMGEVVGRGMATAGAFLMGRRLHDEWAAYWPTSEDGEIADFFNRIDKYVLSNTITESAWAGTTVLGGSEDAVAARLREVRDATEGDIQMSGSATTVRWLLRHGLLDRLHLLVHPVVVGSGQRLFEGTPKHVLDLDHHEVIENGVTYLEYRPRG
ncbi:dihydrofolate reductase family protein [Nocardioides sp. SYSU D00038]|uniref:dihydrofolate reductase family protein n=1 Tax=Nocardioides sp. SYSU D00038 TaxID=2812554 RepID=UPI0019683D78|nr:dihydrofolate reductase family protein [Nocardioides sp. SYSU D00038]